MGAWRGRRLAAGAVSLLVVLAVLQLGGGGGPADAAPDDLTAAEVYVRDLRTPARVLEYVDAFAAEGKAKAVAVVFDTISFSPPSGQNEYRYYYRFAADVDRWLDALDVVAGGSEREFHIAATERDKTVVVGGDLWRDRARALVQYHWTKDGGFTGFTPALEWMERVLDAVDEKAPLVFIGGEITPESWAEASDDAHLHHRAFGRDEAWRSRLVTRGAYWDEEGIGKRLARKRCPLVVVAPEARFCDISPVPELPSVPWVGRPSYPPAFDAASVEDAFEDLDLPDGVRPPDVTGPDSEEIEAKTGGRFISHLPSWYRTFNGRLLFNNDTPGAYGYWPYARAAARSGGRYIHYPFPASSWLDTCPRDPHQIDRLAPELIPVEKLVKAHRRDKALAAICKAVALVEEKTPWSDSTSGTVGPSGMIRHGRWLPYATPKRLAETFDIRRHAIDETSPSTSGGSKVPQVLIQGKALLELLPAYDKALVILDDALANLENPPKVAPRSLANLRLTRFWFAKSAFHLHALALLKTEIESHRPEGYEGDNVSYRYETTIKMSDVLDAYDGRELAPEREAELARPFLAPFDHPKSQSGLLLISADDPDYRAKRQRKVVYKRLDPRLIPRADAMIERAEEVMAHHARTPWGWTVYYAEVDTWLWDWIDVEGLDLKPRQGDPDERDTPHTPRRGSTPGGPTTGGGGR